MPILTDAGPGLVRLPWTILIDTAEKAPFTFAGIVARSFIDPEQREYIPRTERRWLGVGMGDYSIDGFERRIAIERKSAADFQGTLLGWPRDAETAAGNVTEIHRRGRFKGELRQLAGMECKAVVVEATLGKCLETCPQWGKRTAAENAKYLFSTFTAWSQEFSVPFIFCDDRRMAELTAFRIMEQFWHRHRREVTRRRAMPLLERERTNDDSGRNDDGRNGSGAGARGRAGWDEFTGGTRDADF